MIRRSPGSKCERSWVPRVARCEKTHWRKKDMENNLGKPTFSWECNGKTTMLIGFL